MLKQRLADDLKTAMLAGDKPLVSVLRGLKTVVQYAEVADGVRTEGLSDEKIVGLFQKESKKRQDAAELYEKANETERQQNELYEKKIIDGYLPEQLDEGAINKLIDEVVQELGLVSGQTMGQTIGAVKAKSGGSADGAVIARLVKARLS
jgi:uncharacterized protein YqeY